MSNLNPYEQYLLELINRARANPTAEATRFGIDLNEGLSPGSISAAAKQPLAANDLLNAAAAGHSQWMLQADVFSHTGRGGSSAGDRIEDAGYDEWRTWGENISYRGGGDVRSRAVVENHHEGLFRSSGHRENILNDRFSEIGLGQEYGEFRGFNASMLTQNFASDRGDPFLLGVVFNDRDRDGFFDPGEELPGVSVRAAGQGATATGAGGGYEMRVDDGASFAVSFSGGRLAGPIWINSRIGDENVKLDLRVLLAPEAGGRVVGDGRNDRLIGQDGADNLAGLGGNDAIWGGGGGDQLWGGVGGDFLRGGAGGDRLGGGAGRDKLWGDGGNDIVAGGLDGDVIGGGSGSDRLLGGAGADRLGGGVGNDVVNGGLGRDVMAGGQGADRFVFSARTGDDVVLDFRTGEDELRIVSGAARFSDLDIRGTGSGALVEFGDASVTLRGVAARTLDADDFIFG